MVRPVPRREASASLPLTALAAALPLALLAACQQPGGADLGPRLAAPQAQALEVHLTPDPLSGTLRSRVTWRFASRVSGPVDFDFAGRTGTGRLAVRAFGETGEELAIESLPGGGLRVLEVPGANRIMFDVDAPAAPGLVLPREGGASLGLVARATDDAGRAQAWLPIPLGAERVWVGATEWDLPEGWNAAVAPASSDPLHVDGLVWAAGPFEPTAAPGAPGATLWIHPRLARFADGAAVAVGELHGAVRERLGVALDPLDLVFVPGTTDASADGAVLDQPGALLVPETWLGAEGGFDRPERRVDLAAAIARTAIATAPQVSAADASFWRGLAEHVGEWALVSASPVGSPDRELVARRQDARHGAASEAGSVARAAALAHLLRSNAGNGPFLHAVRTVADGIAEPGATPAAFVDALARAAQGDDDAPDLVAVAAPWLEGGGLPELDLIWEHDAAAGEVAVTVVQRQASFATGGGVFPAAIEVEVASGSALERHLVTLTARTTEVRLPAYGRPRWVALDPDRRLPHELVSNPSRNELFARANGASTATGRVLALRQLGERARATRDAAIRQLLVAPLSEALKRHASPWVREVAARELGSIGGLEARAYLERSARADAAPAVRAAALRALVPWAPEPKLAQLADEAFSTGGAAWDQRAAAAELYAAAEPARAGVWLSDRMTLESPHGVLRAALLDLWSRTDTPGVAETLVGWLADDQASAAVRAVAARRLVELARPSRSEPAGLAGVLADPDPRWRGAAVAALGRYRSADAREALRGFAEAAASDTEARAAEAALVRY